MIDQISEQRLHEELIFSIRQFHRYAKMFPIERNNHIVGVLEELLMEAKKMQLEDSALEI